MKILMIISSGSISGGAENLVFKTKELLESKGHDVKILSSDLNQYVEHFSDYEFKHINPKNPLKLLFFLFNPSAFFSMRKILKEYKPDVVHLHVMNQVTPSVSFLLKKYPTVMTLHGPEPFLKNLLIWFMQPSRFTNGMYSKKNLNMKGKFEYSYFNYIQKFFYKYGLKNIDLFIAPSKYMQNMAKADVSPIIHLPNFVEKRKFYDLTKNYKLLFVGRLEKVKGVEFLIESIPYILKIFPKTILTVVGDGRNKFELIKLVKKFKIEKQVRFAGWIQSENLDSYYKESSIIIIPSIWPENFPTVCYEAMSAGRPIIGSIVGGIPEIVDDGINGYLVEPGNSERIAEKVIQLFADRKLLEEMGKNARKKAEKFNKNIYANQIEQVYKDVLAKYRD